MKKRVLLALSLLMLVGGTLVGCNELTETTESTEEITSNFEKLAEKEAEKSNTLSKIDRSCIHEYIDSETGVHYLVYSNNIQRGGAGGMTPRLNADGSLMVDEKEK